MECCGALYFRLVRDPRLSHALAIFVRTKRNSPTRCPFSESLPKKVTRECYTTYVLRLLVFEGHVSFEWSDAILSSVMTAMRRVVRCVPNQWRTEGGFGLFKLPPPPKFRRPSKIVRNSTRFEKTVKNC